MIMQKNVYKLHKYTKYPKNKTLFTFKYSLYNEVMTKRAIIHVENSDNVLEFAEFLASSGWTIVSANKTEELLKKNKIPVQHEPALVENNLYVTDTNQLIRRIISTHSSDDTVTYANQFDIDENNYYIICMNLYPSVRKEATFSELKDAARPVNYSASTVIRSAYDNFENILILTDPEDYKEAMIQLRTENITPQFRMYLAGKALNLVSAFDAGIAATILRSKDTSVNFMNYLSFPFQKDTELHGGANPQQDSCLYKYPSDSSTINNFVKIQGKELTYNILSDVSLAWEQISTLYTNLKTQYNVQSKNCDGYDFTTQFTPLTGTVFTLAVKHKSIVGASLSTSVIDSLSKTYNYDYENITDAILGCSAVINEAAAEQILKCNFSAVVAPGFTAEAKETLAANKNIRLIPTARVVCSGMDGQLVNGGLLLQTKDNILFEKWNVKTRNRPSQIITDQMAFGTLLTMGARSYSAVILQENTILGISQACTSTLKAVNSVLEETVQTLQRKGMDFNSPDTKLGAVLITDAEIPFCDAVKTLIDKGVTAIIQTGGTKQDKEFIDYCNERNVVMVFTGMTHVSF